MKKNLLFISLALILGLIISLVYILWPRSTVDSAKLAPGALHATQASGPKSDEVNARTSSEVDDAENERLDAARDAEQQRSVAEGLKRAEREYNTSITFYGVVLDNDNASVSGANVTYSSTDGSFVGERHLQSAHDGRFTITGIRGKYLDVYVGHPGYYALKESRKFYYYAGSENPSLHSPDPARPEVFRLRKKGEAAELVRREDQVRFDGDEPERSFSLFDHSRRRDVPEYVILRRVETAERDNRGQPIRRLEMEVQDGGIQQRIDPFAFTAPDSGYQPKMHFMRPPYGGQLDYFVKFSNGNYGRFTIMGSAGDYRIDSYLNPDRSPNLEYDREKEITFVETGKMGIDLLYPAKKEAPKKQ